jgi:hypothetical protein
MRQNLDRFVSDDWRQATTEEKAVAWSGYFGYFGTLPKALPPLPASAALVMPLA